MSVQHNVAPMPSAPQTATLPAIGEAHGTFMHVIESGESIYTIAKRYNVTVPAILAANGMASPDKIYVGQAISIPDRPDLVPSAPKRVELASAPHPLGNLPASGQPIETRAPSSPVNAVAPNFPVDSNVPQHVASLDNSSVMPGPMRPMGKPADMRPMPQSGAAPRPVLTPRPTITPAAPTAAASAPVAPRTSSVQASPVQAKPVQQAPAQQVASLPKQGGAPAATLQEPAMSGADKFRWPLQGKVVVDFSASKGTGINIEAPEGTPVRAVENGTVIYVGSGVEGYGNLILIRHANGYVSAYAHLKTMNVGKGDVVNRGDAIGSTGMTGSVSRPQLHFELRKGATPVDPVPLLASN